jgi:hypothetical protein
VVVTVAEATPALPPELRELIESGPMAHLSTIARGT